MPPPFDMDGGWIDSAQVLPDGNALVFGYISGGIYGLFTADLDQDLKAHNIRDLAKIETAPPLKNKIVLLGEPTVAVTENEEQLFFMCGFATEDKKGFFQKAVPSVLKLCRATRPRY